MNTGLPLGYSLGDRFFLLRDPLWFRLYDKLFDHILFRLIKITL